MMQTHLQESKISFCGGNIAIALKEAKSNATSFFGVTPQPIVHLLPTNQQGTFGLIPKGDDEF